MNNKIKQDNNSCEIVGRIVKDTNLNESEAKCLYHIIETWNEFIKLESDHCDETDDFRKCIHQLQYIISMRSFRRSFPGYFK